MVFAMKKFPTVLWLVIVGLLASTEVHTQGVSDVIRLDAALDDIVPAHARVEKLAEGFGFLEGPVWGRKGGYLLFSDIPANVIYRFNPDDRKLSVAVPYSGFTGVDASGAGMQLNNGQGVVTLLGSNAVTLDPQGRIVYCAHGDHQV